MSRTWSRRRLLLSAAAGPFASAACRPALPNASGRGERLYVACAGAGTIAQLSADTGQEVGPAIPAGPTPRQVVAGPRGQLLVLSVPLAPGPGAQLTHMSPTPRGWTTREVSLEEPLDRPILSAAGGRYGAVLYRRVSAGARDAAFRVALVDLERGAVVRVHDACAPGEHVTALAHSGAGTIVHLAVWESPDGSTPRQTVGAVTSPDGHRVATVDLATGSMIAQHALEGVASWIHGAGGRVFAGVWRESRDPEDVGAQVLMVGPSTSWPVTTLRLPVPLSRVAPTPDGASIFGLDPSGERLYGVELATGALVHAASLPSPAAALVATDSEVFVAIPRHDQVLIFDRASHRLVRAVAVGSHPIGLTVGSTA